VVEINFGEGFETNCGELLGRYLCGEPLDPKLLGVILCLVLEDGHGRYEGCLKLLLKVPP
jgi:hypothetical protein